MKRQMGWWLAASLALPGAALAVTTKSFLVDTSEAFEKGTVQGAAVHSSGKVTRAVESQRTPLDGVPVAYASALGDDDAIYVGTGNEGAVYRVDAAGARLFADTPAALVSSLVWMNGTLYAGTLPGGRVYAITGPGKVRDLGQLPGADHVWSLAAADGSLIAATGPEGKLFAIEPKSAKAELLYDDAAEHLLSVVRDREGRLYVGTSSGARLVRIAGKEARVLWDFPGQELTALALGPDFIAVAANDFPAPATPASDNKDLGTAARAKRSKPGTGQLFTLGFSGGLRELARFDSSHISALDVDAASGDVHAGLGHEGRIVRVSQSGERALWVDVDERAIASIRLGGATPYFVSSDGASVYRVREADADGSWTSAVLDARAPARFGELSARSEGRVLWSTRSGNTETPDDSWSAWSAEAPPGPIKSAGARFLQLRAKLVGDAVLYSVEAYYLPQNQPARIRNVHAKPAAQSDDLSKPRATAVTLTWEVDNPDEDKLRYRPALRREGQREWLPLLREYEVLDHPDYQWETRNLPDGWYRVRVSVSDEPSNPAPYAMSAQTVSPPLRVDNHAPTIVELRARDGVVRGRARDELGPIAQLEWTVDDGLWQPLYPDDDLLDTRDEAFHFELPVLPAGPHVVAVRASDAARNVASESLEVSVTTR